MLTAAGFVTVADPVELAVGVTVTTYVRAVCVCGCEFIELTAPPQAIKKPDRQIASTRGNVASSRFRRKVNGAPSNAAQNIIVPVFHGTAGE
jgi:hypothetical protein